MGPEDGEKLFPGSGLCGRPASSGPGAARG